MTHIAAALVFAALAADPCGLNAAPEQQQILLNVFGIPANPGTRGLKPPPPPGDLWRATISWSDAGIPTAGHSRIRVTQGGGYRSPIFADDDQHILALWNDQLVRVDTSKGLVKNPDPLADLPDAVRLVGLSKAKPTLLVVLFERQGHRRPAVVCLDKLSQQPVELANTDEEELTSLLKRLRAGERHYDDVVVASEENSQRGRDVEIRTGRKEVNVSKCGPSICTQGALSKDRKQLIFVRKEGG